MELIDVIALAAYFAAVIGAGFWYRRRAARDLEAYFLGGRRIHWSMLAMSGAVSNFDITGTMWMVSILYLLGMQSWWQHWMWGVALPAFAMAYTARWVRRSRVMTASEWMITRFGDEAGGRLARTTSALMAVLFTVGVVGYAFQGVGKFAAVYLPLEGLAEYLPLDAHWLARHQAAILATLIFSFTTLYVVLGGLYSVVLTDVIQTAILTVAAVLIAVIAYAHLTPEVIASKIPAGFIHLAPSWRMERLAGGEHAAYEMFGLLTIAWIAKGVLMNAGGPGQQYDFQRYLAAASVRDACKLAASWPFFLVVRWAMVMGITLLALSGALAVDDPEQIMPAILREYLPAGVRGLVIAGLLAAFMSTFSSTVNAGAAFIVRDLWQPLARPRASEHQLIRSSYLATAAIVLAGIAVGCRARSIGSIWNWLMMALSAGILLPNFLRWYWWRLNGWGYSAGVLVGIALTLTLPELPEYLSFPAICLGSLLACIIFSFLTPPTERATLEAFHRTVHPFGLWRPLRRASPPPPPGESPRRALANTALAVVGLTALYLGPMYLVGHWHLRAAFCGLCFAVVASILYWTWYKHLPVGE